MIRARLYRLAEWFVSELLAHPIRVLIFLLTGAALSAYYAAGHLELETSTEKMLDPSLPFLQKRHQVETLFPQDKNAIVLLVTSAVPEASESAARQLGVILSSHPEGIRSVYLPTSHPFFDRQGLLYLETQDLERIASDLAQAQPFIAKLYEDFRLGSLLSLLAKALQYEEQLPVALDPIAAKISQALNAVIADQPYTLSWQDLMFAPKQALGHTLHLVIVSPVLDFTQVLPAERAISIIRQAIAQVQTAYGTEIKVSVTGEPVLEHEELLSITRGTEFAGALSLALVCLALLVGFRSFRLTLATLFALTLGLCYSVGFAALAVGRLNLISIAFAVLYIGMGVDYATYLTLRYREYLLESLPPLAALRQSLSSVAPTLFLCALTTALGMFGFTFTPYEGVAELGIIAGSSMFVVVFVTLTAMPALLRFIRLKPPAVWIQRQSMFFPPAIAALPERQAKWIKRASFFALLAALGGLCAVEVDFNPANLRDPNSESVRAFKQLMATKETSPMFLTSLAEGEEKARALKRQLESLPEVEAAVTVFDLVPSDQEEKFALIEELALLLGPQFERPLALKPGTTTLSELDQFRRELTLRPITTALTPQAQSELSEALNRFITHCQQIPAESCHRLLDRLQASLLATFPQVMEKLRLGLLAEPFGLEDLPQDLRDRWMRDGLYRIDTFPAKDMNVLANIREFVRTVRAVDPEVTGLPVIYIESMGVILGAFFKAFAIAAAIITVLLGVLLRNAIDVFLVLLPLVLASVFTGAATPLIGLPFNYANVIALPLLFGLGVNYGVYMVSRMHQLPPDRPILTTSTARGIFFSALTTLASFASLALVSHAGIASMGQLLGLGLMLTLACTFFILPAFATGLLHRNAP
ncbi:MAG: MMPL family transporter [Methylohalobius sp.]|nr:MMPL family transporter [Methylohalobius sp.]